MQKVKDAIDSSFLSPWRGSEVSEEAVRTQLRERYGDECADSFRASTDAMPFLSWASYGYKVRKGEHALKTFTVVEIKNDKDEVIRKIRRNVNLFHKLQVEKVS